MGDSANKKITKGMTGYINRMKKNKWIKAGALLTGDLSLFFAGLSITKTRLNWFTFVSVLLCLPLAKWLVAAIVATPFKSVSKETEEELRNINGVLPLYFEYVFNDEKNFYNVDALLAMDHTIIGYVSNPKTNVRKAEELIKKYLDDCKFNGYTVKLWDDIKSFKKRAYELEAKALEEGYLPSKEHRAVIEFLGHMSL